MVVELEHERVVVVVLQLVGGFRGEAELRAHGVERRQVVLDDAREPVRLLAHLPFVVAEEEGPIGGERRAEGRAELVLVEDVGLRRIQHRPRVQLVVHPEVVQRPVGPVGARLGDDVDEAAEGAAVLGQVGGVEDAELLGRFLRRRRARQAGERLHVVGAVHLNQRVQLGLAAEGQARRRRGSDADIRLLERAAADVLPAARHAARQLDEVDEIAAADRQRFDLLHADDAAQLGLGRLDERRLGDDGDLLGERPEAHVDVRLGGAADGDHDTGANRRLEIRELGAHLVLAGIQRRHSIASA